MGKKNSYKSLNSWLNSPEGKNALGYDNFSYIEGLEDMKEVGFDVHNIQRSLSDYEAAARKAGFGNIEYITENGNTTVLCRPTDTTIQIDDADCPSLEIGHIKDGFYMHNNMPTANNPVFVNNAKGMAGIASAMSISIAEAAKNVSTYADKWKREYLSVKQIARKVKTTTRISAGSVSHLNPALFSKHVIGDYNSSLNPQNMDALAVEGQAMLLQQGMTSYYNHSLYEKHLGSKTGYKGKGAPRDEKVFTRQLETILNVARGSDFKKLDAYVKNNFPWMYEYVWKGDLQNFYKSLNLAGTKSGNRITQGGKKEGAPSIIGLGRDLAPLSSYVNAGRKIQQNLRYNPNKIYHDAANAKNQSFDKAQYKALVAKYGNKIDRIKQDLYFAGEISEDDYDKALALLEADYQKKIDDAKDEKTKKDLKTRLGLLRKELVTKGLGKDASLMSATATKDFRGMRYVDYLKGSVSKEVVDEKIKERLTKKISGQQRHKNDTKEEIARVVESEFDKISELKNGKLSGDYKKEIKKALHSLYGLDSLAEIGTFDFGDGKTFKNIQTIQKLDNNIFTARAGVTDDRTVSTATADEILGYLFQAHGYRKQDIYQDPNDMSKGLKMHIASQQTEISDKNIRDHILRKWNYIVSNADKDELQKRLKYVRHLQEIFKYIEEDDYWQVDDAAAVKYYGAAKSEDGLTAFDFLKDVVNLGQRTNKKGSREKIYQSGNAFSVYTDEEGKQTIAQNMALPEARERHVFSGDRYQGVGSQTHSGSKFDWKVLNSMRGQVSQMERMGVDQEGVDAYRSYVKDMESKLAQKEFEYKTYIKNLQMISKTYGSDIDQFVKDNDKFKTAEIITLEQLMQYNSELAGAYENEGYVQGIKKDDNQLATVLKQLQTDRYDVLEKKWGKEELEKRGIFSWKDISVLADLGEGHDIGHYDYENNKFYHNRYVAFGTGDYTEKNGYMMMDDIGTENYRIANSLKDYYRALSGPNAKEAAEKASRDIMESHKNIAESVERGSIFEKYHTVMGDASSGYMLLSALSDKFEDNFKKTYGKKRAPSMIISTQDAKEMLRTGLLGDDEKVKEAIYKMYAHAFGKTVDDAKAITNINDIINPLIDKYDYSKGGYKGDVLMEGFQFLRNPVIKFAADQLGGGVIFSSDKTVANQGTMRINTDLAAAAKGDMDGDRVAFYIAAMTGDTEAAREALISYYEHLAKNQKKSRKAAAGQEKSDLEKKGLLNATNTGDLSKTSSIMDYYTQNVRGIAMNEGAKGAGIYGDLLFAFEKIFEEANINQSASGKNKEVFLANMASNVAHTLYQEGIAIKNIKGANGEVLTDEGEIANVINAIVTRSSLSTTWTTKRGMTDFLKLLERTGMTEMGGDPKNPLKGVFKGNIIANLGLNNLTSSENDQEIVNLLDAVAKKEILNFKEGTEGYNRLQDDLNRINALKGKGGDLGNISRELLVALITDEELGLNSVLSKTFGEDWGDKIVQRYKYIPGKTHDFERMLLEIGGNLTFDENVEKTFSKEIQMARKAAAEAAESNKKRAAQLRKATKVADYDTSPSKQTNSLFYSTSYGISKDTRGFEQLVRDSINPKLSEEERKAKKNELKKQFKANKDYKELIASQIQGTFSHLASEHYLNTGGGEVLDKKDKAYQASMKEEIKKRGLDTESVEMLKAVGFGAREARTFIKNAQEKGAANAAFLANIMKNEGGEFIGSEINLAGIGAIKNGEVQLSNQITDAMYKVVDEETGKTIFHNVDFKNTKDGKVKAPNLFQITDYIESGRALNDAILKSDGPFDARAYLEAGRGKSGDIYQKIWAKRIDNAIKFIMDEEGKTEEEAREKAEKQFEDLTKQLGVENAQFIGDIIAQDDKGVMNRNIVHSLATNDKYRKIYEAYRDGDESVLQGKSIEEFSKEILADPTVVRQSSLVYGGGKDGFEQLFEKEYQELVKNIEVLKQLKEVKEKIESDLRIAQRDVEPNQERINELKNKIKEKEKEIETVTKTVQDESDKIKDEAVTDVYGRTYRFKRKDIDNTIAEMTDTTEYENFLNAQEVAAAKNQLADYNAELKKITKQLMILKRELNKEGLSENAKRVLEQNMAYGQADFFEKFGKYSEVYRMASEDINAKGSDRDKAWLKEMDFSIGSDNLETFKEQTNRELDLEERKKSQRFFNYALEQYTKLEKLNSEIRQTTEAKNTAEVNGDEVEVELLSKKIAFLEEELKIRQQTLKVEQFSLLDGYTKEADENAKRVAELRSMKEEKEEEAKKKPTPKQQGGGSSGRRDFLGIDSYTASWLSRIMQGGALAYFIRTVRKGLKDITEKAKQLDQAMTNLRIVTGQNAENARTLITSYAKLGKDLGATTIEVTTAATAWLRQGYEISQVNDLITATMYLSKLGMIDTAAATKDLTSAMKGFKLEASEAMDIVDKLTALDVKAATTAGDIAEGLSQFANIASLNGVNIDQAAAYVATIADVNQQSGTTVGQALKTIMSRYGNVKAGAYNKLNVDSESDDTSEKLNDVERILTKMGISIRKTNLEFKDFDEVMDEIAEKWGTMDNVSKKAIANAFAGIRQQESFLILAENYDKYKELVDVSETSAGTAEKKYQSYKESYTAAKNEFTAALEQFANSSEVSKLLTDLLNVGKGIVEGIQKILPILPMFVSMFMFMRTLQGKSLLQTGYKMIQGKSGGNYGNGASANGIYYSGTPRFDKKILANYRAAHRKRAEDSLSIHDLVNETDPKKRNALRAQYLKQEREQAKLKEKEFEKELKYRQQSVQYSRRELEYKKSILSPAEKEVMDKIAVKDNALMEELRKEGVVREGQKDLTYAEGMAILESGVLSDKKVGAELENRIYGDRQKGQLSEDQIAAKRAQEKFNQAGGLQGTPANIKGVNVGSMLGFVSGMANMFITAASQYKTAALTHKFGDETVESSKEAQQKGAAWSSVISMVPVVGSFFGPIIAESIAAAYDKQRDQANADTKRANERLNQLSGISSYLQQIADTEQGTADRHKLVKELRKELFDEDNKKLRNVLQRHLGSSNLSSILNSIDSNTENSAKALKDIQIAQIQAEKAQISAKYASSVYENNKDLGYILSEIDNYDGITEEVMNENFGIITGSMGAGAAGGALIGALGGPVGAAAGALVGLIGGIIGGAIGASNAQDSNVDANKRNYQSDASWKTSNVNEKIAATKKALQEAQDAKEPDTNKIAQYQQLIDLLEKQRDLENEMTTEINDLTLQEALVSTNINGESLPDMTIEELKNMGNDRLLTEYAKEIEKSGGLAGVNLWADDDKSKLSLSGYNYLFDEIRKQGDEEINAVLAGDAYTLEEVLKMRSKYGADSIQVQKLLRSFADSLNLTVDQLDDVVGDFGKLTLSDTFLSPEDLHTKTSDLANLISAVTEGAGATSSWMETLISQFPELIYYMGDTSKLFDQSILKIKQYSNEYVNAQYQSIMDNTALFSEVKDKLYETIGGSAAEALRDNPSITRLSDIMAWVQTQYDTSSGQLSTEAENVLTTVQKIADEAGMKVTNNILKQYYDMLIDFKSKQIDREVENLESQKEALKEITNQREYENQLVEARLKLEDAGKQKKRVYRAGVGWTYQSDQAAIESAEKELDALKTEKKVSEIDERITTLQAQKQELSEMYEKENYENLEKLYKEAVKDGDVTEETNATISLLKSSVDGISKSLSELIGKQSNTLIDNKKEAVNKAREAWGTLRSSNPGSTSYNTALKSFHSAMDAAVKNKATESDFITWASYDKENNSSIEKGMTAWDVYNQDINDQYLKVKTNFALPAPNSKGAAVGFNTGDILSDPAGLANIFFVLKQGAAAIWDENGNFVSKDYHYKVESTDEDLSGYLERLRTTMGVKKLVIAASDDGSVPSVYYENGKMFRMANSENENSGLYYNKNYEGATVFNSPVVKNAMGNLGLPTNSISWINEVGTEAIITPQGTLTALPSKTGILPADITKNLWQLGEVAPSLLNIVDGRPSADMFGKSIFDTISNDDSFNIDNLVMNVNADSSFDVEKFISLIRSRVALTKNSK